MGSSGSRELKWTYGDRRACRKDRTHRYDENREGNPEYLETRCHAHKVVGIITAGMGGKILKLAGMKDCFITNC